jgi:hypothetical protein
MRSEYDRWAGVHRCDWCNRTWKWRIGLWLHWKMLGEVK